MFFSYYDNCYSDQSLNQYLEAQRYNYNNQNSIIIMQSKSPTSYIQQHFMEDFLQLGHKLSERYAGIIHNYKQHVIPFQEGRMNNNQKLILRNSSLQKDKIEYMNMIQKLKSEKKVYEQSITEQTYTIQQLTKKILSLEQQNKQQKQNILNLQQKSAQRQQLLEKKTQTILQLLNDKESLSTKLQVKNDQYNILLANLMKSKNEFVQKLNEVNEQQRRNKLRQKQLEQQQFYLNKQLQELENQITPKQQTHTAFHTINQRSSLPQPQMQKESQKQKTNHEILRTPMKKIIKYHENEIYSISMNYNGNILSSVGGDRYIKIYDLNQYRLTNSLQSNSPQNIYISNDLNYAGERILVGSTNKKLSILDVATLKQMHTFIGHGDKINSVTWLSHKEKCASASEDKQIKIWDVEKGNIVLSMNCGRSVKVLISNSIQPIVYSGHGSGSVRIYSTTHSNAPIAQINGLIDYPITHLHLMSPYEVLVASNEGTTAYLLDLKMNKTAAKYQHNDFYNPSFDVTASSSKSYVIAGNCDGNLIYWDRFTKKVAKKISGHNAAVTTIKYHMISDLLVSTDKEGSIIVWQ